MTRLLLLFGLILAQGNSCIAQYISSVTYPDSTKPVVIDAASNFSKSITVEDLKQHVYTLASDEFGGRELGTEGNDMAAEYIANKFSALGLSPTSPEKSFYQPVAFSWIFWDDITITANNKRFKHLWDFIAFPDQNQRLQMNTDEVVFLGYGIDDPEYSDYKRAKVKDKVVLVYNGEPRNAEGNYVISDSDQPSKWSSDVQHKINAASRHGASLILIVAENLKQMIGENRRFLLGPKVVIGDYDQPTGANHAFISTTMAKAIIGDKIEKVIKARNKISEKGRPACVKLKSDLNINQNPKVNQVTGRNVIGLIEGTDLKDEYIIVSAHYDHIGKKGKDINNGADDNASGTSTVLEMAEAFKQAQLKGYAPRRSILFTLVTGEEKGLLGSEYYVENPLVPLEQTVVDINIDMVGRLHKKYEDNPNYIFVIGSDRISTDLHKINEEVNQNYSRLILDYTYNDEKDPNRFYYRSDHYNFAKKGIPSIFFFNGAHADYHRPTDTAEKINYEKMTNVARHIFVLTWELANRTERINKDVSVEKN